MNRFFIMAFIFLGISATYGDNGDSYGRGREANKNSPISAVNRFKGDRTWLVLRRNKADIMTIPDTPKGIVPKLEDAYMEGDQLSVVMDFDWAFCYRLYSLDNGTWKQQKESLFYPLNIASRARLILVQMPDLSHVRLSLARSGNVEPREKGVVKPDDVQMLFDFPINGGVLKNSVPYDYNSDQESD